MVPFLPAGAFLGTSGWQTRAGTHSPGTTRFCPKLALGELLHWSWDRPQVIFRGGCLLQAPSIFLSHFPRLGSGVKRPCPCPVPPHPGAVLCQSPAKSRCRGHLFGPDPGSPKCAQATGWHQDGGCHPFVPVSPAQGMKPASGKRSRLWGISYQPSYVPAEFQQGAMLCASHRHLHVLPGICVCLGWI